MKNKEIQQPLKKNVICECGGQHNNTNIFIPLGKKYQYFQLIAAMCLSCQIVCYIYPKKIILGKYIYIYIYI